MLDLYSNMSVSPNVLKVIIALEELDESWQFKWIDVMKGEQFSDAFQALNPNGRVPVVVDRSCYGEPETIIFESGAILAFLGETRARFFPIRAGDRATVLKWLMFQMSGIGPMFGQFIHFSRHALGRQDYAVQRYAAETQRLFKVLDGRLGCVDYLASDYSIADMATYPWISYFFAAGLADPSTTPAVARWTERMKARPAVQRAHELAERAAEENIRTTETTPTSEDLDRLFNRKEVPTAIR